MTKDVGTKMVFMPSMGAQIVYWNVQVVANFEIKKIKIEIQTLKKSERELEMLNPNQNVASSYLTSCLCVLLCLFVFGK